MLAKQDFQTRITTLQVGLGSVDGDTILMTNRNQACLIETVRREFSLHSLLVANGLTALAMCLPRLLEGEQLGA